MRSRYISLAVTLALALLLAPPTIRAEIIDRIAITVGNQVITESQIDEEIRVTAFLNREKADLNPAAKKEAAGRLIQQALVRREMDVSKYPLPELSSANESLQTLEGLYPNQNAFDEALQLYGITKDELTRRLWWQLTLLRFIDYRFRPGILVTPSDVQAYYRQQLSKWQQAGIKPIPTLDQSRDKIEEILTQNRIDTALDQWVTEARNQVMVTYLDPSLR